MRLLVRVLGVACARARDDCRFLVECAHSLYGLGLCFEWVIDEDYAPVQVVEYMPQQGHVETPVGGLVLDDDYGIGFGGAQKLEDSGLRTPTLCAAVPGTLQAVQKVDQWGFISTLRPRVDVHVGVDI